MWYDVTLKMTYGSLHLQMEESELHRLEGEWSARAQMETTTRRYDGRDLDSDWMTDEDEKGTWQDTVTPCHLLVDLYEVVAIKASVALKQGE